MSYRVKWETVAGSGVFTTVECQTHEAMLAVVSVLTRPDVSAFATVMIEVYRPVG